MHLWNKTLVQRAHTLLARNQEQARERAAILGHVALAHVHIFCVSDGARGQRTNARLDLRQLATGTRRTTSAGVFSTVPIKPPIVPIRNRLRSFSSLVCALGIMPRIVGIEPK